MKLGGRALPFWILFLGIALRVYAAVSHLDISHPDEHFQTLEPASHVVYGFGWLSWEWTQGTRSWLVPALYMPVLWICKVLGFNGGVVPIVSSRLMMAALSGFVLYQFWLLLCQSGFKRGASLLGLAVFALSPACAAWGVMTLSDVWAMVFLWGSMPFVLRALTKPASRSGKDFYIAGALLGLSFLARIQMVLWPIGIGLVLLFRKPFPKKTLFQLAAGYSLAVLFQGALDWVTWGFPFHSVIENIRKNLLEHVASFYGVSPWYDYLQSIPSHLGITLVAGTILLCAAMLALKKVRFREREALIGVPALLYFVVHSLIAHKEVRFMFPVVPVVFYFLAWGLNGLELKSRLREDLAYAVLLFATIFSTGYVYSNDHTYLFDLSTLTQKIREDGGLSHGGCLILLDHYWIWTRGELMIGSPIRYVELSSGRPLPKDARSCEYAISLPGREHWFEANGGPWTPIFHDQHGQVLYKRVTNY